MSDTFRAVDAILDELNELAGQDERVRLADLVEALGHRGIGIFLFLPALVELSPIGSIPGVPTVLASIVLIFAVQILIGRHHMWLPGFLARRTVAGSRIASAARALRPIAERLDRWFYGRLKPLARAPFTRVAAMGSMGLAMTVPPLELVPFASTAPMGAIAAFGLALLVRDGALMLVACALSVLAVGTVWLVVSRVALGG